MTGLIDHGTCGSSMLRTVQVERSGYSRRVAHACRSCDSMSHMLSLFERALSLLQVSYFTGIFVSCINLLDAGA